ncbi:MAG: ribonuclease E/G, partial [Polaromonas sp.]|nr:ribonuclease E/G [Polaromonas sp.]
REGGRSAERSGEARPDLRAESQPRGEGRGDRNRRDRPERAERGAERSGAPRDAAQEELALANQAAMAAAARGEVTAPEAGREERQPREPREPRESRGEGRRERGGRRPERRDDAPAADGSQAAFADGAAPDVRAERTEQTVATDVAVQGNEPTAGQEDSQERAPRERRSRDRYGRERRERGDRVESSPDQAADANAPAFAPAQQVNTETRPAAADIASPVVSASEVPAAPVQAPAAIIVPAPVQAPVAAPSAAPAPQMASAPAPTARALPQVASYDLPLQDLAQVASASGLQWVNSNTSKIAETQAAMAAEPRPAHVPRERAPVVAVQASPLVLVETKRDLSTMTLPFEDAAATQRPQ